MEQLKNWLNSTRGYATYGLCAVMILHHATAYLTGGESENDALNGVWEALTAAAIRRGVGSR